MRCAPEVFRLKCLVRVRLAGSEIAKRAWSRSDSTYMGGSIQANARNGTRKLVSNNGEQRATGRIDQHTPGILFKKTD